MDDMRPAKLYIAYTQDDEVIVLSSRRFRRGGRLLMARTRIKLISGYEADIEDLVNDFIEDPKNKVKKVNAVDFYLFGVYDDDETCITACVNYELGE